MNHKEIKLDPKTREQVIVGGNFEFVYGIDAVMQNCECAVRAQLGEYRYDVTHGVDYTGNLFSPTGIYSVWEVQVINTTKSVSGVISARVRSFEVDDKGGATYTIEVETVYGSRLLNGSV